MEVITMESEVFRQIMAKLDQLLKTTAAKAESHPEWLTGKEVMKILGVTSRTLQKYRDTGILDFSQVSRKKILYKRADVMQFLEDKSQKHFKK
jgi:hypothetical protein